MKTQKNLLAFFACFAICFGCTAHGDVIVDIDNLPVTIVEGTATVSFELSFSGIDGSGGNDVGAAFDAPGGSGLSLTLPRAVMTYTLQTAGLSAGDIITLNPNANNFAAVSLGGNAYTRSANVASFTVTAVPEPSTAAVLVMATAISVFRRRMATH